MTRTKHLTLRLSPDDHSWLIRKARSLNMEPDDYVAELIDRERTRDLMSGKVVHHLDGDRASLELGNLELRDAPRGAGR